MAAADRPEDLRCPVWRCRKVGARWVVLHEHWRLAICERHADDVDAHPEAWRLAAARPDGSLRIARAGAVPTVDAWDDDKETAE